MLAMTFNLSSQDFGLCRISLMACTLMTSADIGRDFS